MDEKDEDKDSKEHAIEEGPFGHNHYDNMYPQQTLKVRILRTGSYDGGYTHYYILNSAECLKIQQIAQFWNR